ncbi:hypothetical protein QN277_015153 [Acacia crassicarpa]|uniref:Uncharacterized protein n=1 Tax=Acacia crassicarpa TaxID=499986 RepID=A0AAE1MVB7_9FABA|nr:hypothetical protein QN277_015153 [Acacia crassicarpa]
MLLMLRDLIPRIIETLLLLEETGEKILVDLKEVVASAEIDVDGGCPFCIHYQRPRHTTATCYNRDDASGYNSYSAPHAHYAIGYDSYPQANHATPFFVADPSWYVDSGANYHVTPHPKQLDEISSIVM